MKYKALYDYGVRELMAAGIEESLLDARLLLEHVCHTDRNDLLVHGERDVQDEDKNAYQEYIKKKAACSFAIHHWRTGIHGACF